MRTRTPHPGDEPAGGAEDDRAARDVVHGLLVVAAARAGLLGQLDRGGERPVAVDADREQQLDGSGEGKVLGVIGA